MLPVSASSAQVVFSREKARRFFQLSERQLRSWEKQGFVPARESYGLTDLVALKTLIRLKQNRVPTAQLKRAVLALRSKIRYVTDPLTELRIYSEGSRIRVDIEGSTMEPVSGQLLLNFGRAELDNLLSFPASVPDEARPGRRENQKAKAELLFEEGLDMEQRGAPLADTVAVYEEAIRIDPDCTGALVNLGTIYFNAREHAKAEEFYRKAINVDPHYALAHFNLGNLYDEQGRRSEALEQYLIALELNPQYGDAHYNLALLYQNMGQTMKAVRHWKAYLKVDPASAWAAIARRELDKLKDATIVRGRA